VVKFGLIVLEVAETGDVELDACEDTGLLVLSGSVGGTFGLVVVVVVDV